MTKNSQSFDNKKKVYKGLNSNLKCTHCGKLGHLIDRCFELVGYPTSRKSRYSQNNKSNNVSLPNNDSNKDVACTTSPLRYILLLIIKTG